MMVKGNDEELDYNPDLNRDITFTERFSTERTRTNSLRSNYREIRTENWWILNSAVVYLSTRGVE